MLNIDKLRHNWEEPFLKIIKGCYVDKEYRLLDIVYVNLSNEIVYYYNPKDKNLFIHVNTWHKISIAYNNKQLKEPWNDPQTMDIAKYFFKRFVKLKFDFIR